MDDVGKQSLFPPLPVITGDDRPRKPDIHVGFLEQQVALDDQFLGKALVDSAVKQARRLVQYVVTDADRVKGDVTGDDDRGFYRSLHQLFDAIKLQLLGPALYAVILSCREVMQ